VKLHSLILLELFTILIHFEKTVRCCTCLSATTLWLCLVEGSQDLIDVVEHGDLNLTMNGVIQGHTDILVYLASAHRHCSGPVLEDALIFLSKILNHDIHDLGFAMAKLAIIYMKSDSHLVALNHLVGDARIIWVDRKVNVRQALDELPKV
jgi:hypothetical protein